MSSISFTWSVSDPDAAGDVMVRCHIDGTEITTAFGPMPGRVADSFIRAKRDFLDRRIRTIADAVRIFTPPAGKLLQ